MPPKLAFLLFALMASPAPVDAQTPTTGALKSPAAPAAKRPPEKSYKPISLTIAAGPADPSFASFRQELAGVAKNRVYAELVRLVVAQGFFWAGDFAGGFDPRKSSAENFAAAIRLERGDGMGWNRLAAFAALPDATPMPSWPGVICAPSRPQFDEVEFDRMNTAAMSPAGWVYPRAAGVAMRAAPKTTAGVIERLGLHLVRLLGYEASEIDSDSTRTAWAQVAAPSGKTGYAAPGTMFPLRGDQLCYVKDMTGRWRIAGYVTAGE
jgi:hypothetical protein